MWKAAALSFNDVVQSTAPSPPRQLQALISYCMAQIQSQSCFDPGRPCFA